MALFGAILLYHSSFKKASTFFENFIFLLHYYIMPIFSLYSFGDTPICFLNTVEK